MTEKPNNEADGDDTAVRPAVSSPQRPTPNTSSTQNPSTPTPRRADGAVDDSVNQPVRKDASAKAKARAAAAAGPAAGVGLSSGNAPGAASAVPAAPASPVASKAPSAPPKAPTFTAAQVLRDSDADRATTQELPKTDTTSATADKAEPKPGKRPAASTLRTRKARLRLAKVDPWSVMKTTFAFSIAFGVAGLAAVLLLYGVISSSGLFESVDEIVNQVLAAPGDTQPFELGTYLTAQRVAGATIVIGVLNVVLLTAIGTLTAFLYNLASSLLGGLEVTLAED